MSRPCGHRWDIGLGFAAHQYAGLGYAVLPLEPGGKRPHRMLGDEGGVHWAASSAERVSTWWSLDSRANIGVAAGAVSQLVVVDLDVKKADGPAAFREYLKGRDLGFFSADARTPSGGWHCWLRLHSGMSAARERPGILPGVDIKGNGGYVVAAPSVLEVPDGGGGTALAHYAWTPLSCPCWAPPAPAWMADWISYAPSAGSARLAAESLPDAEEAARHGFAAGERNVSFYLMDCRLYGAGGVSFDTDALVRQANLAVWDKTDHSGMTWSEVEQCRKSARAFIERNREAELTVAAALAGWNDRAVGMTRSAKRGRVRGW